MVPVWLVVGAAVWVLGGLAVGAIVGYRAGWRAACAAVQERVARDRVGETADALRGAYGVAPRGPGGGRRG